jgi:hypothetical protein
MPVGPQLPFEDNTTLLDTDTIGTEIQAYHPNLDELSALTLTTAGKALLDDADAAAQRTTLGLGTLATQSGTFSGTSSGTNTGDQTLPNVFNTIAVSGQSDVVADSTSDTLTLVAGANITITTNASTDTITISSSGGGGGGGGSLGDGDYGDITVSGSATVFTIDPGVVTLAKMADMATDSFLGRDTAGTGSPEVLSVSTAKTLLGLTGTNSGDQTSIVGITGTKAEFDSACTDGNFLYVGDVSTPNTFSTIAVSGQSDVVADSSTDTLTLVAGSNITLTTNAGTDTITIAASGTTLSSLGINVYTSSGDITATGTAMNDVTGCSFTATANKTYLIDIYGTTTSVAATTGIGIAFNIPDGTIYGMSINPLATTGTVSQSSTVADDTSQSVSSGVPATTVNPVVGHYKYVAGVSGGTVQLRYGSEVAASSTLKAGTVMRVHQIN